MHNIVLKNIIFIISIFIISGCNSSAKDSPLNNKQSDAAEAVIINQELALIPAGEFIMGTDEEDEEGKGLDIGMIKPLYVDEHPGHKVYLEGFYIDKYEVTNSMFKGFANSSGHSVPSYFIERNYPLGTDNDPVNEVNWFAAKDYCAWNGKYLPNEAEWEKAARGTDGRKFPWGGEFDKNKSNSLSFVSKKIMPVGKFEDGKSPYGVYDMVGNVYEWTDSWYEPYEGNSLANNNYGKKFRVIRGASYGDYGHFDIKEDTTKLNLFVANGIATTTYRMYFPPDRRFPDVGFRCAKKGE